ncbi:efflux RND transporter periplasmic adaptor subunit [Pseudocolwellia sp. HL-MZ7]|uniref:efflux RND transporter periplasmic adaptor subunit n=1 Tax=Pseudocolwellia sp. HL-MZ7 TaxID=3400627 RepID=UPI003CFA3EDA
MGLPLKIYIILVLQSLLIGKAVGQTSSEQAIDNTNNKEVYVRGVISARDTAVISSRINGFVIKSIPFSDGEAFEKGVELVSFDCTRSKAEAKAARATAFALETTLKSNQELDLYGAIGKNDVLISQARLESAQAEALALEAGLNDCIIKAPYAGRVVERLASIAESPTAGTPVIKIQREKNLEIKLIAPSHWLSWLEIGTSFSIKIDENGKVHEAYIVRLGAVVDPVSKTIKVIGRFKGTPINTIPGMSGDARFISAESR